jgi:hypothetical protein
MTKDTENNLNIWSYKPWWCQPWSIILTGILLIVGSWLLLKTLWITLPIATLIFLWWWYFLILYPELVKKVLTTDTSTTASETSIVENYSK